MKKGIGHLTLVLWLIFVSYGSCAMAAKSTAVIENPAYARAQRLVDVGGGRRMNLYCVGHGSPTVVFDAGLGNWSQLWGLVQPAIATSTTACTYDRAGLGFSDPSDGDGSSATIVADLHKLLTTAGLKPPYVLVGHSYGGMSMRLFADQYPSEVVGLVLVDPSTYDLAPKRSPEATNKMSAADAARAEAAKAQAAKAQAANAQDHNNRCIQAAEKGFKADSDVFRECVSVGRNPRYSEAVDAVYQRLQLTPEFLKARWKEEIAIHGASADQLRSAARSFGAMPLIVLTQSEAAADPANAPFVRAHQHMASLSTRGQQRIVPESSHTIPLDQPQAVVAAIEEVLHTISGSSTSP